MNVISATPSPSGRGRREAREAQARQGEASREGEGHYHAEVKVVCHYFLDPYADSRLTDSCMYYSINFLSVHCNNRIHLPTMETGIAVDRITCRSLGSSHALCRHNGRRLRSTDTGCTHEAHDRRSGYSGFSSGSGAYHSAVYFE